MINKVNYRDFMNIFKKLSLVLVIALLVVPALAIAVVLNVSITSHTSGADVTVGQPVQFTGSATGGTGTYTFNWTWGDGEQTSGNPATHTYTTTGSKTVQFRATDTDGITNTQTITIDVVPATNPLAISTVTVTDITENSAIVRWTTNKPATSRVIYDTVTHANVDTTTGGPNYTYANSTSEDLAEVTTHAVTVTGLTANTQYFFRVISEIK